jgi:hypothetical protein
MHAALSGLSIYRQQVSQGCALGHHVVPFQDKSANGFVRFD